MMIENASLTPTATKTPPASINLRVDTALLRSILEANPTAKLAVESVAVEKISEEILRKIKHTDFANIQRDADARVQRAMADSEASFKNRYKFPVEAVVEVERIAKEFFERELRTVRAAFITAVEKEMQNRLNLAETILAGKVEVLKGKIAAELIQLVREQARAEFLAVLQEVKGMV